jgi:hypothetical protein
MEWGGVEWNVMEWNVMGWNGREWKGLALHDTGPMIAGASFEDSRKHIDRMRAESSWTLDCT